VCGVCTSCLCLVFHLCDFIHSDVCTEKPTKRGFLVTEAFFGSDRRRTGPTGVFLCQDKPFVIVFSVWPPYSSFYVPSHFYSGREDCCVKPILKETWTRPKGLVDVDGATDVDFFYNVPPFLCAPTTLCSPTHVITKRETRRMVGIGKRSRRGFF